MTHASSGALNKRGAACILDVESDLRTSKQNSGSARFVGAEEKKAPRLPRTGTRKRGALPNHLPRTHETVAGADFVALVCLADVPQELLLDSAEIIVVIGLAEMQVC